MASERIVITFGSVITILVAATMVGRVLAGRYSDTKANAAVAKLNARIDAWWIMVTVIAAAFALGATGVTVLCGVLSFASLREFVTWSHARREDHWALVAAFFVVLPLQYYITWLGWFELFHILVPVYAFVLLPIASLACAETRQFLQRTAEIQWGVMLCVFCLSHVPALLALRIPGYEGQELLLVVFLVLITQASDVLQYVCGKLFGRQRIAPGLSPSKTVAGLAGGIGSATILGAGLSPITPFRPWQAALLALTVALLGFLGGLVMSAIKRDRGIKDWGWAIKGHGGVLDRLDSVVFAAPVFFYLVRCCWAS